MADSLNDDLNLASWRDKLDKVAGCIQILRKRIAQCSAPEPSIRQQVIRLAINDDVP